MTLVSVIIPTYNCAKYVVYAIRSVLEQSYKNAEIIVVDDGSTDDTKNAIQPYMKYIKYIYQGNRGLPGARNRGLKEASGDFVAFLDADDRWRPEKLEIQTRILETVPSVCIVFTDFSVFDENGYQEESFFKKAFPFFQEYAYAIDEIFPHKYKMYRNLQRDEIRIYHGPIGRYLFCGNFILPSSVLMRKSAIDLLGGFDEKYRIAEETEFFLRLCTSYNAAYVESPMVDYLIKRAGNLTGSSNTERLIQNAIDIQKNYLIKHSDIYESDKSFYKKAVSKSYSRLAYYYLSMTLRKEARKEILQSISWNPFQVRAYAYLLSSYFPKALFIAASRSKRYMKSVSVNP